MKTSSSGINPVKYCLVGFGRFCRQRLVPAFEKIQGSEIAAIQKRSTEEAEREAETFSIPAGYGDLNTMLRDADVEAVYITSANSVHTEQAIAAAHAGKHVLCEKPLAITSEECSRIIEACRKASVHLMVAQNLRFSGVIQQLKQLLSEDMIGKPVLVTMRFTYTGSESLRKWIYNRKLAGGGAATDLGVHCIDTLRYLLGEIAEVQADLKYTQEHPDVEETANVNLTFDSGVMGQIFCSYESPYWNSLEVIGTRGRAYTEMFAASNKSVDLLVDTNEGRQILTVNSGNTYGEVITHFSKAVRDNAPIPIPGEEGLRNQQIIEAIYAGDRIP